MTPHQLVGIQIGGVARQEVHGQPALGRGDVFAHDRRLVRRQTIEHQMNRLAAVLHHLLEQLDEQVCVECAFVDAEPERSLGIDCRSGAHRLSLSGALYNRGMASRCPGLAMNRVGPESGFVPEEHLGPLRLGLLGNGWIGFALPLLDRFGIALIRPLQRLLRREPQCCQELSHCRETQLDAELLLDQFRDHRSGPQTEVQAILPRIAPIDPSKHLALLCRRKAARASRRLRRTQRLDSHTGLQRSLEPFVDRGAIEPIGRDYFCGRFTFANSLDRHQPNRFQRLVIKCPSVSFHAI